VGGFTASFQGLKELDAKLEALKPKVAHKLIHDALMDGGEVLRAAVAERAPERVPQIHGNAIPPGALKRDIEIAFGITDEGLPAAIIKPGRYTIHVARWLEYGHRLVRGGYSKVVGNRTRGPGKAAEEDVPAYPFIRPAFETARALATTTAVESLKSKLPFAAGEGGRGLKL